METNIEFKIEDQDSEFKEKPTKECGVQPSVDTKDEFVIIKKTMEITNIIKENKDQIIHNIVTSEVKSTLNNNGTLPPTNPLKDLVIDLSKMEDAMFSEFNKQYEMKVKMEMDVHAENTDVNVPAEMDVNVPAEMDVSVPAEMDVNVPAEMDVNVSAEMDVNVSAEIDVNVPTEIDVNVPTETEVQTVTEDVQTDQNPIESFVTSEELYFKDETIIELSRYSWRNSNFKQQYTRGCIWSPDGSCILTAVNSDGMHVIDLPIDLYQNKTVSSDRPLDILQTAVHVKERGTVYDYCWFPFMNSGVPETCFWIASRQHEPIQMWDAFNGELKCSYRGYNSVDEVETAISVAFSTDGEKIFGGYKKSLKIFQTVLPGRDYDEIPIKQPCSCIALHSSHKQTIATGSWNSTINLYDLRTPKIGSLGNLLGHTGGVTYLKFSPTGETLISGSRKDNQLLLWDMRNFSQPIRNLSRNVETNQRIYFDISQYGNWLVSGDTKGIAHAWSIINENTIKKEYQFPLHKDCCNGISIHPSRPILGTSSGQYHFLNDDESNEVIKIYENALIFWWVGEVNYTK